MNPGADASQMMQALLLTISRLKGQAAVALAQPRGRNPILRGMIEDADKVLREHGFAGPGGQ